MKTLIAALAAVTTVTAFAAPAAAQSYDRNDKARYEQGRYEQGRHGQDRGFDINQRQRELNRGIDRAIGNRQLTRNEAARLNAGLRDMDRLEQTYRSHGFDRAELRELDRRMDVLERQFAASVDPRYGEGYGHRR